MGGGCSEGVLKVSGGCVGGVVLRRERVERERNLRRGAPIRRVVEVRDVRFEKAKVRRIQDRS
jgi:hypothetical protein